LKSGFCSWGILTAILTTLGVTFFTSGARVGIAAPKLPVGTALGGACAKLATVNVSITAVSVVIETRIVLLLDMTGSNLSASGLRDSRNPEV
jgi:hypothetical protein